MVLWVCAVLCHLLLPYRNTEHDRKDVLPACQLTLKNLGIDYLDLYLVSVTEALCVCVVLVIPQAKTLYALFLNSHQLFPSLLLHLSSPFSPLP